MQELRQKDREREKDGRMEVATAPLDVSPTTSLPKLIQDRLNRNERAITLIYDGVRNQAASINDLNEEVASQHVGLRSIQRQVLQLTTTVKNHEQQFQGRGMPSRAGLSHKQLVLRNFMEVNGFQNKHINKSVMKAVLTECYDPKTKELAFSDEVTVKKVATRIGVTSYKGRSMR